MITLWTLRACSLRAELIAIDFSQFGVLKDVWLFPKKSSCMLLKKKSLHCSQLNCCFVYSVKHHVFINFHFGGYIFSTLNTQTARWLFHVTKQIETNHRQAVISLTAGAKKYRKTETCTVVWQSHLSTLGTLLCTGASCEDSAQRVIYYFIMYIVYEIYIHC